MLLAGIWILAAIVIRRGVTLTVGAQRADAGLRRGLGSIFRLEHRLSRSPADKLSELHPGSARRARGAGAVADRGAADRELRADSAAIVVDRRPFLVGVALSLARVLHRDVPVVNTRGSFRWVRGASVHRGDRPTEAAAVDAHRVAAALGINLYAMAILQAEWLSGWVPSSLNRADHAVPVTFLVSGARRRALAEPC